MNEPLNTQCNLDLSQQEAYVSQFTQTVLPAGTYDLLIVKTKVDMAKGYLMLQLQVLNQGEYAGARVSHFFSIGGDKTAVQITRGLSELKTLFSLYGMSGSLTNSDVFLNKSFQTEVQYQKESTWNGKPRAAQNWISFSTDKVKLLGTPAAVEIATVAPSQFTPEELAQQAPPPVQQAPLTAQPPVAANPVAPTPLPGVAPPQGDVPNW